ncbi:hypothetical protein QJQ45_000204 [Haematococcus lacustris]|nr:hypothetical protein QJQ45_000204 [Haematococcus lacustris]
MDEAFSWVPRRLLSATTDAADLTPGQVALYACICLLFVCGSGMAAGLTLGLMSLDKIEMEVLMRSGSAKEQALARRILPLISDPHWLLVTLLLCNAGCFEALPIFLDILVDPVGAILISVTLILIFGEILPQAVCARHGLAIGAACSWLVLGLKWLTCPVSWPLARALDLLLGKEGHNMFKRKQLKTLIDLHGADEGLGGKLTDDEVQIICGACLDLPAEQGQGAAGGGRGRQGAAGGGRGHQQLSGLLCCAVASGALDLTSKIAYSAMTPLDKVVMLSHDAQLDRPAILQLLASGHSRVPVFSAGRRQQVVGLLLVKELLQYAFEMLADSGGGEGRVLRVADLKLRSLPSIQFRLFVVTPVVTV